VAYFDIKFGPQSIKKVYYGARNSLQTWAEKTLRWMVLLVGLCEIQLCRIGHRFFECKNMFDLIHKSSNTAQWNCHPVYSNRGSQFSDLNKGSWTDGWKSNREVFKTEYSN